MNILNRLLARFSPYATKELQQAQQQAKNWQNKACEKAIQAHHGYHEVCRLKEQNSNMLAQLCESERRLLANQTTMSDLEELIAAQKEDINDLRYVLNLTRSSDTYKADKICKLIDHIDGLSYELETALNAADEKQTHVESLKKQNAKMGARILLEELATRSYQRDNKVLQDDIETLKGELHAATAKLAEMCASDSYLKINEYIGRLNQFASAINYNKVGQVKWDSEGVPQFEASC